MLRNLSRSPERILGGILVSLSLLTATTSWAQVPETLVLMQEGQVAFVVEKAKQRLSVYRWSNDSPVPLKTYPVTTGQGVGDKFREGDLRTPEGIYLFTRFIDGSSLPAEYGVGAAVMDYPNPLDHLLGKNGDGIWLHATDDPSRISSPYTTRGCVVVRNEHYSELKRSVVLHYTPIIVGKTIEMVSPGELAADRAALAGLVESWRSSWERTDLNEYISHYDRRFRGRGMSIAQYAAYKKDVFARSADVSVKVADLQILRHGNLAVAHFFQEFHSSLLSGAGRKVLHMSRESGQWKIIAEQMEPLSSYRSAPSVLARARFGPAEEQPVPPSRAVPAAVTASVVSPPAVTRPAPQPPASTPPRSAPAGPELLGADRRVVSIDDLQAVQPTPGRLEVSFQLKNSNPLGERIVGRLAVLVSYILDGRVSQASYPPLAATGGRVSRDLASRGEYFAIQRFKVVRAAFAFPARAEQVPAALKVCVYDRTGAPLLIKDFPVSRELGEAGASEITAGLTWKGKS